MHEPHLAAAATLTLALPKDGLRSGRAAEVVGDLYLGDISVPPAVYERLGLEYRSPFGRSPIVKVEAAERSAPFESLPQTNRLIIVVLAKPGIPLSGNPLRGRQL